MRRLLNLTYVWARRCAVALIGSTVILIGVAMIVLPGPALVVIPAGLAILGLEFACARRWLRQLNTQLKTTGAQLFGNVLQRFRWFAPNARRHVAQRKRMSDQFEHFCAPPWLVQRELRSGRGREADVRANRKTGYYPAP